MTSSPSLITVPLPPATGSSIDESVRRPASRPCLRRPNSSKAGEFSNGTFGEFTSGTDTKLENIHTAVEIGKLTQRFGSGLSFTESTKHCTNFQASTTTSTHRRE